jgi:hypothetical protein
MSQRWRGEEEVHWRLLTRVQEFDSDIPGCGFQLCHLAAGVLGKRTQPSKGLSVLFYVKITKPASQGTK